MNVTREIERLEYALAMTSIDHGRGPNPCNLDIGLMERQLVLLRAYKALEPVGSDMDAIMAGVAQNEFGNMAVTDPIVAGIVADFQSEAA